MENSAHFDSPTFSGQIYIEGVSSNHLSTILPYHHVTEGESTCPPYCHTTVSPYLQSTIVPTVQNQSIVFPGGVRKLPTPTQVVYSYDSKWYKIV